MSKKKKVLLGFVCAVVLSVVTALIVFFLPFAKTEAFDINKYRYIENYQKELGNIPVFSQETGYTCYVVSMAIVKNHFGVETTESELRAEINQTERVGGMLPDEWLSYAKQVFAPLGYSVSQVNPISQTEIVNVISDSLENDLPVVMFYSAVDDWNKPHYNTHYAMIYGIDMQNELVKISNPYGYLEELTFTQLYDGLDFTSYEAEPFLFRLGRKVGLIKPNNLFVFEVTS